MTIFAFSNFQIVSRSLKIPILGVLSQFAMKVHQNTSFQRWRSQKHVNTAAERNKEPICQVLKKFIPPYLEGPNKHKTFHCLEISSGSGQHVAYFAPHFPSLMWQPSEMDITSFGSISAYIQDSGCSNIQQPIYIDVSEDYSKWGGGGGIIGKQTMDFILNINLMHISPFKCTEGLFHSAGQVLKFGGLLFTYGPFAFHGKISPESNVRFDSMLRSQNPEWGLRDVDQLTSLASASGLQLMEVVALPANNHCLVWKRE